MMFQSSVSSARAVTKPDAAYWLATESCRRAVSGIGLRQY